MEQKRYAILDYLFLTLCYQAKLLEEASLIWAMVEMVGLASYYNYFVTKGCRDSGKAGREEGRGESWLYMDLERKGAEHNVFVYDVFLLKVEPVMTGLRRVRSEATIVRKEGVDLVETSWLMKTGN